MKARKPTPIRPYRDPSDGFTPTELWVMGRKLLSINEAAKWLRISPDAVGRAIKRGELFSYDHGTRRLIPELVLNAHISARILTVMVDTPPGLSGEKLWAYREYAIIKDACQEELRRMDLAAVEAAKFHAPKRIIVEDRQQRAA